MGAPYDQQPPILASAATNPVRRAPKNFQMDEQTRFLYLILKQLDVKTVNWQQVADSLGIKNGHAARMRWSRFKGHVEGSPPVGKSRNRQDEGKSGNGKIDGNAKDKMSATPMSLKRYANDYGPEDDDDFKRVKMEQAWPPMHGGGYGYGSGTPQPPYYPGPVPYGMPPPHHSHLFGPPPPNSFHPPPQQLAQAQFTTRPHIQDPHQPPPPKFNLPTAPTQPATVSLTAITKPAPVSKIKSEPMPEKVQETNVARLDVPQLKIKPEPAAEPMQIPATIILPATSDPKPSSEPHTQPLQPMIPPAAPSRPTDSIQSSSTCQVLPAKIEPKNVLATTHPDPTGFIKATCEESQDAPSALCIIKKEDASSKPKVDKSNDDHLAIKEVSKEDFAQAVNAEAAVHAKQSSSTSPKIPLTEIRTTTSKQHRMPAPMAKITGSTLITANQGTSITSGIVARAALQAPASAQGLNNQPSCTVSKPRTSDKPKLDSPRRSHAPSPKVMSASASISISAPACSPPPPALSSQAPQLPSTPSSSPFPYNNYPAQFMHPYAPPYVAPVGNYSQPPYPHRPHHPPPHPYWHSTAPHINNPPPMSAPPYPHSFNRPIHPHLFSRSGSAQAHPHLSSCPQSAPSQTTQFQFGEMYTLDNPPPPVPNSSVVSGESVSTPSLDMDAFAATPGDEFDLMNFDFGMGVGILDATMPPMGNGEEMGTGLSTSREPQSVVFEGDLVGDMTGNFDTRKGKETGSGCEIETNGDAIMI